MLDDRTRASDAEREQTVAVLRAAVAEGRLNMEELDERTATAYGAATRGELELLIDDLPHGLPAPRPARKPKRPRVPGRIGFHVRRRATVGRERTMADVLEYVAPSMQSFGYEVIERSAERIVFERDIRPAWTVLVAVCLFPLGLLALLYTASERVTIELLERGDETVLLAQGVAPLRVRRAFAELET